MDSSNLKKDTPIKKHGSSNNVSNIKRKDPTISDVWDLLNSIQLNASSQDNHLKNINKKLQNLENNFNSMKTMFDNLHSELSQLKLDKLALESDLSSLRDKVAKLENTSLVSLQPYDVNIFNEIQDRITREKNIIIYNVPDSTQDGSDNSFDVGLDLLKDLSLSDIKIINAKRIGKFGSKDRPILVEFESVSNVKDIFKSKSKLRLIDRWRKISITEDRTASQRSHMKNLRSELTDKRNNGDNSWFIKYVKGIPSLVKKN